MWAWTLNDQLLVREFVQKSVRNLKVVSDDFEIVLVDHGNRDRTWEFMQVCLS